VKLGGTVTGYEKYSILLSVAAIDEIHKVAKSNKTKSLHFLCKY